MKANLKADYLIYLFILLIIIYVGLLLFLPANPESLERFSLEEWDFKWIRLVAMLPFVAVWMIAIYGHRSLKQYTMSLGKAKEKKSFEHLSNGVMVLAFSLPLASLLPLFLKEVLLVGEDMLATRVILGNFINLALFAVAMFMISAGARGLVKTFKKYSEYANLIPPYLAFILITVASVFSWLVTDRPTPELGLSRAYYLPEWLLLPTIVAPYLVAWTVGLMAAYHLNIYNQKVGGTIYRSAFSDLAKGVTGVIIVTMAIQLLNAMTLWVSSLGLASILFILTVLIFVYAVGFGYIARGANKLRKIEEA